MSRSHSLAFTRVIVAALAVACAGCTTTNPPIYGSGDPVTDWGQEGDRTIDIECIITPRPKMNQISAILTYDYADVYGASPFVGDIDVDKFSDGAIVMQNYEGSKSREIQRGVVRVEISWPAGADPDAAYVDLFRYDSLGTRVRLVPTWTTALRVDPSNIDEQYMPHVFSTSPAQYTQEVHIKAGGKWATLKFSRAEA